MKQGYRDVGYLFAPHIRRFKPPCQSREGWRRQITILRWLALAGDAGPVHGWFQQHYLPLMQLMPQAAQTAFAEGVIDRWLDRQ